MIKLRFRDINWLILDHTAGVNGRVAESDFWTQVSLSPANVFPMAYTAPIAMLLNINHSHKKLIQWNCQLCVETGAREFECNRKSKDPQISLESDISVSFFIIFQYPFQNPWRHCKELANKWPIGLWCLAFHLMLVLIRNLPENSAEIWEARESILCKIG